MGIVAEDTSDTSENLADQSSCFQESAWTL